MNMKRLIIFAVAFLVAISSVAGVSAQFDDDLFENQYAYLNLETGDMLIAMEMEIGDHKLSEMMVEVFAEDDMIAKEILDNPKPYRANALKACEAYKGESDLAPGDEMVFMFCATQGNVWLILASADIESYDLTNFVLSLIAGDDEPDVPDGFLEVSSLLDW